MYYNIMLCIPLHMLQLYCKHLPNTCNTCYSCASSDMTLAPATMFDGPVCIILYMYFNQLHIQCIVPNIVDPIPQLDPIPQ